MYINSFVPVGFCTMLLQLHDHLDSIQCVQASVVYLLLISAITVSGNMNENF